MENLIFSLNATIPIFLMMLLGMLFRKLGWMDEVFAAKMNKFVFLVPLPVLLFEQLATVDFSEVWDIKFILFCFVVTAISITISTLISLLWKDRSIKGEFIQATYRSSAALLGIAFIQNIYGTAGMAPLMIIGSVPLYNIMAVVVLSVFEPEDVQSRYTSGNVRFCCHGNYREVCCYLRSHQTGRIFHPADYPEELLIPHRQEQRLLFYSRM